MKVECSNCQAGFTVPDEKIPRDREIRILCPKCRMPIALKWDDAPESASPRVDDEWPETRLDAGEDDYGAGDGAYPMDMHDDGMEAALVCVSDPMRRDKIEKQARIGYQTNVASTTRTALGELRHNRYDILIVDENFDGSSPEANGVLRYIQPLPMQMRRSLFVCLLSDSVATADHMAAFRAGVNLVVNGKDVDKIKIVLDRVLKEHKLFYRVFRDELDEKGRL